LLVAILCLSLATATAREPGPLPKIGELWISTPELAAFAREPSHDGLRDLGYRDGSNITLLARYAGRDPRRLPALVDELIAENVDILFLAAAAVPIAMQKTRSIPIVCASCTDPVAEGFAASLSRPGANVTGLSWQSLESSGKRLELATELVPGLNRLAVMFDHNEPGGRLDAKRLEAAGTRLGLKVRLFSVGDAASIDSALARIRREGEQALILSDSNMINAYRKRIATFAVEAKLPLISEDRSFAEAGAVLTYGPNVASMFRRAAIYVERILNGANPAELPIEQPTQFNLIVNMATARAIGITIPKPILSRADEVMK
jgi:putative ABC transport system substrate-binding protein